MPGTSSGFRSRGAAQPRDVAQASREVMIRLRFNKLAENLKYLFYSVFIDVLSLFFQLTNCSDYNLLQLYLIYNLI